MVFSGKSVIPGLRPVLLAPPRLAVEINFALNGTEIFEDAVASNLPRERCTWRTSPKVIGRNGGLVELLDEHSKGQLESA